MKNKMLDLVIDEYYIVKMKNEVNVDGRGHHYVPGITVRKLMFRGFRTGVFHFMESNSSPDMLCVPANDLIDIKEI